MDSFSVRVCGFLSEEHRVVGRKDVMETWS